MSPTRSLLLLALFAVSTSTNAFAPQSSLARSSVVLRADALEVVEDSSSEDDPFDAYKPTSEQTTIAFKDFAVGSGYTVGDEDAQLLKLKYTATFIDPKPGYQFDQSESFVCKTGQNKILPGFEEGLKVCNTS